MSCSYTCLHNNLYVMPISYHISSLFFEWKICVKYSNVRLFVVQSCPKLPSFPRFNYTQGSGTGTGMSLFAECLTFLRIPYVPLLRFLRYSKLETLSSLSFQPPRTHPIPLFMPAPFQGTLYFSFLPPTTGFSRKRQLRKGVIPCRPLSFFYP